MSVANITVIGSGAAATTTLIELLNQLIAKPANGETLNITIVEKYPEFFKGIPYGSRSSVNALTITAAADFVYVESEKKLFNDWLIQNLDEWTNNYRLNGGLAAEVWLEKNLPLIANNRWDIVYIPRHVFGIYMQNKLLSLLAIAEEKQLVKVTLIQAEAIDVKLNGDALYEITLESGDKKTSVIKTQKLVIAIGSAPVKNNAEETGTNSPYVYINELYEPSLDDNLKKLNNTLIQTPVANDRNVLIIGSNASCIELLYLLDHRPDILDNINKITVISRAGILPYYLSEEELDDYPCKNLDELKVTGNYNVHTLVAAARQDMGAAIQHTVFINHINRIIGYTIELLNMLDEEAKNIFFSIYGPQITKLIRRSGPAYKGSADNLIAAKKLELVKGNFLSIEKGPNGGFLNYDEPADDQHKYLASFKVIINCSGSNSLQTTSSRLLSNLINKKIVGLTLSGEGLVVNEKFEAAPNLYIMGPLLAGNVNKIIHFWHLENVSRLLYLAPYLGEQLIK
jgi:uncharacterized NAD(P)/FAD-binding protein YdhS